MEKPFNTAEQALKFITGGKSTFTVRSIKTGVRFTYKVKQVEEHAPFFVKVLNGPDNEYNYDYIGFMRSNNLDLQAGNNGKPHALSFKSLQWVMSRLKTGVIPEGLEIWHEGTCCRCNRKLTVPESVESGIGPECAKMIDKQFKMSLYS